jgi:hypothetical protein
MAPLITLYILGGCVAAAVLLFIVMSIVSAVRPPQLPSILEPPPLQRMIRALTPLPMSFEDVPSLRKTPVPMMPATPRPVPPSPPPAPAPPPIARHAIPIAPAQPAPPIAAPRPAPAPSSRAPVVLPVVPSPFVSVPAVQAQRGVSLPLYPARRGRKLVRFVLALFLVSVVAGGTIVAHPALLDLACDDYEWVGAETAQVVRERAYEVHYTIGDFIADLRARL